MRIESQKRNIYHVKQFFTNEAGKLANSVFINGVVEWLHDWTNEKLGTLSECQVVLNLSQPIFFQKPSLKWISEEAVYHHSHWKLTSDLKINV